ncbi:MAG: hypothetical protein DRQ88_05200 [Epsilonproteobacteria bacterium]|nr:MAG: hypothetical protein DRQ89_04555 [Campylobacterota bacterium]RLA66825.1 MAG: hypothetical protein DRQ88_05200 [Campylobacterota bacterium]
MRAVFIADIGDKKVDEIIIEGSNARHLITVVRIRANEKLMVLDGNGTQIIGLVKSIEDKKITLTVKNVEYFSNTKRFDLALGIPKKDAFEDSVRAACEIGLGSIIPVQMEYSQFTPKKNDRLNKLIESSLIQSNNPFFLDIKDLINFKNLTELFSSYDRVFYFCSHQNFPVKKTLEITASDRVLMVIGPEGGLSAAEEEALSTHKNVSFINLPSYILKTPTAVSVCSGWLFAKMPN